MPLDYQRAVIIGPYGTNSAYEFDLINGPIHIDPESFWELAQAPERTTPIGSYDPQSPIDEEIPVIVTGPTRQQARLNREILSTMLVNADRYAKGLSTVPTRLQVQATDSASTCEMLILGQVSPDDPTFITSPTPGRPTGSGWIIPDSTLKFKRRGPITLAAESSLTANLIPASNPKIGDTGTVWTLNSPPAGSGGVTSFVADADTATSAFKVNVNAAGARTDTINSQTIGAVSTGQVYTFSAEFAVPLTNTGNTTITVSLWRVSTSAIIGSATPFVIPAGSGLPFVDARGQTKLRMSGTITSTDTTTGAQIRISIQSNGPAGDKLYIYKPALTLGESSTTAALWRDNTARIPQVAVTTFPSVAALTSALTYQIGPFNNSGSGTGLTNLPQMLLLLARDHGHLQHVVVPNILPSGSATLVSDTGRSAFSSQQMQFAGTATTGRGSLALGSDVRRVKVFCVCRATVAASVWRMQATLYSTSNSGANYPLTPTYGYQEVATTGTDPFIIFAGEGGFASFAPNEITLTATRLSGTGNLIVDQVVVMASDTDLADDILVDPTSNFTLWSSVSDNFYLTTRYDPRTNYRPQVNYESALTRANPIGYRGSNIVRTIGNQIAAILLAPTGTRYTLVDASAGALTASPLATRYTRVLFPK